MFPGRILSGRIRMSHMQLGEQKFLVSQLLCKFVWFFVNDGHNRIIVFKYNLNEIPHTLLSFKICIARKKFNWVSWLSWLTQTQNIMDSLNSELDLSCKLNLFMYVDGYWHHWIGQWFIQKKVSTNKNEPMFTFHMVRTIMMICFVCGRIRFG